MQSSDMIPVTVNSSIAGSIPMMTITGQNSVVATQNLGTGHQATLPNVLNVTPSAPTVATMSPYVMVGTPQVMGAGASAPGITLQTLQSIPQEPQGHLLVKNENGQYQLLTVRPAPTVGILSTPQPQLQFSTIQTHFGVPTVSSSVTAPGPMTGQIQTEQIATQVNATPFVSMATTVNQQPPVTQKPLNNTEKCRNFFVNILDLSHRKSKTVGHKVHKLVQELIYAQVEPEEFCSRLERLLNACSEPCLIGFLKNGLPQLRQSLATKELVIEGINPPLPQVAFNTLPTPETQPIVATSTVPIQKPFPAAGNTATVLQNIPVHSNINTAEAGKTMTRRFNFARPEVVSSGPSTVTTPVKSLLKEKENKVPAQFPPQPFVTAKMTGVGDISDVPAMAGVNLASAVLQNIPVHSNFNTAEAGKTMTRKFNFARPEAVSSGPSTVITPGKSLLKEKENKVPAQLTPQPFVTAKRTGVGDINDVPAMAGVNLAEESQIILDSTKTIGTQIRSCKDEYLVPPSALRERLKLITAKHGLEDPSADVTALVDHAVRERLKNLIEKLAVIARHRVSSQKLGVIARDGDNSQYEVTQDVKSQLTFLKEAERPLPKISEHEILEEFRRRDVNAAILHALGPPKKRRRLDAGGADDTSEPSTSRGPSGSSSSGRSQLAPPRPIRVNMRDMLFLMEQDKETARSLLLYLSHMFV